jgi:hypothetical protein
MRVVVNPRAVAADLASRAVSVLGLLLFLAFLLPSALAGRCTLTPLPMVSTLENLIR